MSRLQPATLVLGGALALSGCVVGPNYRPAPTPPVAAGQFAAGNATGFSTLPPPPRWWHLYDDPAIDGYVEQALTANTDLRVASANLARARALLSEARAGRLPSTTIIGSGGYSRSVVGGGSAISTVGTGTGGTGTGGTGTGGTGTGGTGTGGTGTGGTGTGGTGGTGPGGTGTGGTTTTTTGTSATGGRFDSQYYSAALDVSYELDLFGRVRRTIAAARADAAATEAARDFVRVTVAAETTRAYADACAAGEQFGVAQQSLQLQTQTFGLTERLYTAGRGTPLDVARARALLEETRATLPTYAANRRVALFRLAVLTGQAPEVPLTAAAACVRPPRLTTPLPVGDGTALLQRRPDIREADRNLAAATARIGVATAALYPQVTLGGSIGSSGLTPGALFSSNGLTFNVGPLISWTFPNVAVARARIAEARASNEGALASFDGAVLTALQDTETALAALAGESERYASLTRSRDFNAEAARIVRLRYGAGRENFLAVLDAERTLANTQALLAVSEATLSSDQISLFKALGGGWENAPAITRVNQAASGSSSISASAVRN